MADDDRRLDDIQHIRLVDLPAIVERAAAERWTALAVVRQGGNSEPLLSNGGDLGVPRKQIVLVEAPIGDAGAEALSRLTNLTSLNLMSNQIGDTGAAALSKLINLTSLDLMSNQIGDTGAVALSKLINLNSLDLWDNRIGDAGAEALSRLINLSSLNLMSNQIGDVGAVALSRLINLTSLKLMGNPISAEGAEALSRLINLTSLSLTSNRIGDAGAVALSKLTKLSFLQLGGGQIGDAGAAALSKLTNLTLLELWDNQIGDAGATALSKLTNVRWLDLSGNQIGPTGGSTILDAWADPANAGRRRELQLAGNNLGSLLPAELLNEPDVQTIIAAWRTLRREETGQTTLPAPESVGKQAANGVYVGTTSEGRLTTVDPALASDARDDALGRELHAEVVAALDAVIQTAGRSNALADWRQAAEEARERLGDGPPAVRLSAILRIERLRALREADERRRDEPDPLTDPVEPGAAAALREAVAAANLYIATDPWLDEQQRRIADPGTRPVLSLEEATTAEADLDAADLAEDALLDEVRSARETAETGGEAGRRAELWLNESWRNIVIEATRQTLAWLRDATGQARAGAAITVDDAAEFITEAGVKARLAAMRAAKAAGESTGRIWQHAEPELGKRLAQATVASGFLLFVGYNLPLVTRLTANADLVAALQRLFGG